MNMAGTILAYFIPIGFLLVAWGGLPPNRARAAASTGLMVAGLAMVAYMACGFAFQFGGLGFAVALPGYESLRGVYAPLDASGGAGGLVGLRGFFLDGSAASPEVATLFLHHLPLVITAAMIPALALAGRLHNLALGLVALFVAGVIYPLAGHWVSLGGWLSSLGVQAQLGHGVVDLAGAGPVYALGGLMTLVGLVLFGPGPRVAPEESPDLPPAHFPLLAVAGAALYGLGWMAWVSSNPLYGSDSTLNLSLAMVNGLAAAMMATLVSQAYSWFATSQADPLMAARGWVAGWIIVSAGAPFIPTWTALVLGALAGIWVPLGLFMIERGLRRDDSTAALTMCGLIGLLAVLMPGVLADGNWGAGWNGVGSGEYLAVVGQGVTGMLVPPGFMADPGQLTAQLIELAAIVVLALLSAGILFGILRVARSGSR